MSIKNCFRMSLAASLVLLASSACGQDTVIYVDCNAGGTNDGTDWADAYVHLQDALAMANSLAGAVEIRVAQGTYGPDQGESQTPRDREATFQLVDGVTLRGGFAGFGEVDPDAWDPVSRETILSGDLEGNDSHASNIRLLAYDPSRTENSYHVVSALGVEEAVLDGFFIIGGHANGEKDSHYARGGGFYCDSGSPKIVRCVLSENTCDDYGAAIYLGGRCEAEIACCHIIGNSTPDDGGGIFIKDESYFGSAPLITNCIITGNWAGDGSGGIRCDDFAYATIRNCVIAGNASGDEGGGISCKWQSKPFIENCTITGNSSIYGGGIYCIETGVTMVNCILRANRANHGNQIAMKLLGEEEWRTYTRLTISFSDVQGGRSDMYVDDGCELHWSAGNIDADPCFADLGRWDQNGSPRDPEDDFWIDGDYHLRSEQGRYDPDTLMWTADEITSPCIDAGDPDMSVEDEPEPTGARVNMGAYGGTDQASKSPSGQWGGGTGKGTVDVKEICDLGELRY